MTGDPQHPDMARTGPLDCTAVDELAAAYALDAVPEDEVALIEAHLRGCDAHSALYADLQDVADILPLAVEEVDPPSGLKGRILAAAARPTPLSTDGRLPQPAAISPRTEQAAAPIPIDSRRRRWASPTLLALAAAVLIAIGLGAWNISLQRSVQSRTDRLNQQQLALNALASGGRAFPISGGGIAGSVVVSADGSSAFMVGTMPDPPSGKVYEAWIIRDGKPLPAGLIKGGGAATVRLQGSARGAQAVAFTLEPPSGSSAPTVPPLASTKIG